MMLWASGYDKAQQLCSTTERHNEEKGEKKREEVERKGRRQKKGRDRDERKRGRGWKRRGWGGGNSKCLLLTVIH